MKSFKLLLALLLFVLSIGLTACNPKEDGGNNNDLPPSGNTGDDGSNDGGNTELPGGTDNPIGDGTDYVAELKLDMNSETAKAEATVKTFIDGDTVHFNVNEPTFDGVVLKARFLAINTPESTGKIEEYGKQASKFTKEKLSTATSIIVESDDSIWNTDSTGGRYMVWVWYQPAEGEDYRNLNLEILQNGLAVASNTAANRYGTTCVAALEQAKALKLKVHSGQNDPLFYYGEAQEVDLKELRTNISEYVDAKVAFEAVIFADKSSTLYVQEYFVEDDTYYGIQVYYGKNGNPMLTSQFKLGNRLRIVGTVQEWNGIYQVSGLDIDVWNLSDPNNTIEISKNNEIVCTEITAEQFNSGMVSVGFEDEEGLVTYEDYKFTEVAFHSYIEMKNLQITNIYTTQNGGDSDGAMTFTCQVDGQTIKVRTEVLYDSNNKVIKDTAYNGKNINVKGVIESYTYDNGNVEYQIKVFFASDITINN